MAPILLKEFVLPVSMDTFIDAFWLSSQWYERFLVEKLEDVDVTIEEWAIQGNMKQRKVRTFHPSSFSFPGLPSHAESLKTQTIETISSQENHRKVIIKELNVFNGIPYADYFTVSTEWTILSPPPFSDVQIWVYLDVKFHKSTWLQGTIESNTKAELLQVMEKWCEYAGVYIRQQNLWEGRRGGTGGVGTGVGEGAGSASGQGLGASAEESGVSAGSATAPIVVAPEQDEEDDDYDEEHLARSPYSRSLDSPTVSSYASEEEDALFFDCEDGGLGSGQGERHPLMGGGRPPRRSSSIGSLRGSRTPPRSRRDSLRSASSQGGSARDMAVQVVETLFVLYEFLIWQVFNFYAYDLKTLFDVDPEKVLVRIVNSFLPGWHSPLLVAPDMYGPLIGVLLLPQTLLLLMETAANGCNSTTMLGNTVIVCLLIWLGGACLYRLLALVVAPSIGFKQCLSILGYSFYSWNIALLCTLPLEHYIHSTTDMYTPPVSLNVTVVNKGGIHDIDLAHPHSDPTTTPSSATSLLLPMTSLLPLVLIGLPSSLAQGYVYWEHTPPSSIRLPPSALPASVQQFASQHPRLIKKVLWAFPKIIAFILVAGTHYQLLWYIARVFLPGRRQLCRLSALIQPSQYADILTQKDLRVFAQKLLSGRED